MELATYEWGQGGKLAVLLHGMADDSTTWEHFSATLTTRGYRVLAVDLPGHGNSPTMPGCSAEEFAVAVLESLPREPELALGHSLGGMTLALLTARLRPQRAVYSEPVFRPPGYDMSVSELADVLTASVRHDPQRSPWDALTTACFLRDVGGTDLTPDPATPSLVQFGEPSGAVPPSEATRLRAAGLVARGVPGAGHSPHLSAYEEFLASLDGWL